METLCRIPISKPLTHRIILIKEIFSGMSLTRERPHELDKIFLHLFTFANKLWFSHSRQQILYSLPWRDPIWNVHSLIGQPFKVIIRIFWKFILIKNKFLSNYSFVFTALLLHQLRWLKPCLMLWKPKTDCRQICHLVLLTACYRVSVYLSCD